MHSENTWSKAALIVLWTVHLLTITICIGVLAVDMMEYAGDHEGTNNGTLTAFMVFFVGMLILTPLEMVFNSFRFLDPWTYLSFQLYRVVFSLIFIIVEIVTYVNVDRSKYAHWISILNIVLIIVAVLVLLSALASLWYGAVVLRRWRKAPRKDMEFVSEKKARSGKDDAHYSPASSLMAVGGGRRAS